MALLLPVNAIADVYRGFKVNHPYPVVSTPISVPAVAGHLRHHVRNGRLGNASVLHWTHVLYLPPTVDVRSAYNSQLNTWQPANADTILVADYPISGWCTAFLVVLVQRLNRGTLSECLRVCLDRLQPQEGPCPGPGITPGCCPNPLPLTLQATLENQSGCPCLDGEVVTLNYTPVTGSWFGFKNLCGGHPIDLAYFCGINSCASATLTGDFDGFNFPSAVVDPGCSCSPLQMVFSGILLGVFSICPGATIRVTITV